MCNVVPGERGGVESGQRGDGNGNTEGNGREYEQDASRPGQTHSDAGRHRVSDASDVHVNIYYLYQPPRHRR